MHIALVHHAVIPPKKYGGTERVVFWLAKALISKGHQVTVLAKEGSVIPGATLIPFKENWESQIPANVDVVHLWTSPRETPKKPYLVTIEGNGRAGEKFLPNTVFVSAKHASFHGSQNFVYNGIDLETFESSPNKENYLVFLAKASWKVKNLEGAIQVAQKAKMPLHILGSRDWPFGIHKVFQKALSVLVPGSRMIQYWGMVGDAEKKEVLKKARGLIFPVLWHEPFGIAVIEALASGCPVFATPYGSLPELVTPDVGTLSNSVETLAQSILQSKFLPENCIRRVKQEFTMEKMAEKYLKYYQAIRSTGTLEESGIKPANPPETRADFQADFLLPWRS